MSKAPIVATVITLASGLVLADTVSAQFGPIGTRGSQYRGELRVRERDQAAEERTVGMVVSSQTPAAWEAVRQFRATGKPAMLGITIFDRDQGVAVLRVSAGGPAEESGVEEGDVIVAVDGVGITESERGSSDSPTDALLAQMGAVELGDTVTLTVQREGDEQEIEIETRELGPASQFVL